MPPRALTKDEIKSPQVLWIYIREKGLKNIVPSDIDADDPLVEADIRRYVYFNPIAGRPTKKNFEPHRDPALVGNAKYPGKRKMMFDQNQLNVFNLSRAFGLFRAVNKHYKANWDKFCAKVADRLDDHNIMELVKIAMELAPDKFSHIQFKAVDPSTPGASIKYWSFLNKQYVETSVPVATAVYGEESRFMKKMDDTAKEREFEAKLVEMMIAFEKETNKPITEEEAQILVEILEEEQKEEPEEEEVYEVLRKKPRKETDFPEIDWSLDDRQMRIMLEHDRMQGEVFDFDPEASQPKKRPKLIQDLVIASDPSANADVEDDPETLALVAQSQKQTVEPTMVEQFRECPDMFPNFMVSEGKFVDVDLGRVMANTFGEIAAGRLPETEDGKLMSIMLDVKRGLLRELRLEANLPRTPEEKAIVNWLHRYKTGEIRYPTIGYVLGKHGDTYDFHDDGKAWDSVFGEGYTKVKKKQKGYDYAPGFNPAPMPEVEDAVVVPSSPPFDMGAEMEKLNKKRRKKIKKLIGKSDV